MSLYAYVRIDHGSNGSTNNIVVAPFLEYVVVRDPLSAIIASIDPSFPQIPARNSDACVIRDFISVVEELGHNVVRDRLPFWVFRNSEKLHYVPNELDMSDRIRTRVERIPLDKYQP